MVLRTALVDAEPEILSQLEQDLTQYCPTVLVAARCQTSEQAIETARHINLDLLLLDTHMPGLNRSVLFESLQKRGINAGVIYLTPQPLNKNTATHLIKPINPQSLKQAVDYFLARYIERTLSRVATWLERPTRIRIPSVNGFELLVIEDIVFCEADGSITKIFLSSGRKVVAGRNLGFFEKALAQNPFCRTHHRYLVNLNFVRQYQNCDHSVLLSTGASIPVAHQKLKDFLNCVDQMVNTCSTKPDIC